MKGGNLSIFMHHLTIILKNERRELLSISLSINFMEGIVRSAPMLLVRLLINAIVVPHNIIATTPNIISVFFFYPIIPKLHS
jgi:hypothetical protein